MLISDTGNRTNLVIISCFMYENVTARLSVRVYVYICVCVVNCTFAVFRLIFSFARIVQKLEDSLLPARTLLSKSNDELSVENCDIKTTNDLLRAKHNSTSSSISNRKNDVPSCKAKRKLCNRRSVNDRHEKSSDDGNFGEIAEQSSKADTSQGVSLDLDGERFSILKVEPVELGSSASLQDIDTTNAFDGRSSCDIADTATSTSDDSPVDAGKLTRPLSEPSDIYFDIAHRRDQSPATTGDGELARPNSEPALPFVVRPKASQDDAAASPLESHTPSIADTSSETAPSVEPRAESACAHLSPIVRNRFRNVYAVHTSTPSSLLRRSLATNDYMLTPITNNDDRSMSPITQSATKMSKAMQVCEVYVVICG